MDIVEQPVKNQRHLPNLEDSESDEEQIVVKPVNTKNKKKEDKVNIDDL